MDSTISRRRLLAGVGLAAGMAGCLSRAGEYIPDTPFNSIRGSVGPGNVELRFPAVDKGRIVDNFEDLSTWSMSVGDVRADDREWVHGSQSMRLESLAEGDTAGVFKQLEDGLNLSRHHLSMAVKVDTDGPARITTKLLAPNSGNHVRSDRRILSSMDGWQRIDLGYTAVAGEPDMSSVEELWVSAVNLSGNPIRVWIDDLRATTAARSPKAVLVFDGGHESHYETVFAILQERGMPGVVPIEESMINSSRRLQIDQLRDLRDAGWDVASRPDVSQPLPQLSPEEQRDAIERNRTYLEERGFARGPRHFFPYGYQIDAATIDIIRDVHATGVTFGGCPNANPPVSRYTASRFNGGDGESTRQLVDIARRYNQSVILGFSQVGPDAALSVEGFEDLLEFMDRRRFEIVSLSQLFDD